jgi:hypothetical protein
MGGAAGHLNHLYDNPLLTFGQLKDIFTKASGGQILGTEKTDGINLFLSYSVKDGEAKAARNKTNIKNGGLNAEALASKFNDRGALLNSFKEALSSWAETVNKLNPEILIKLFGPSANIYYNCEIQDPGTPNVINYDTKNLVIHPTGHVSYDPETNVFSKDGLENNYEFLSNSLNKVQSKHGGASFKVLPNVVRTLKGIEDKIPLQNAISQLDKIVTNYNLNDNNSISDYITIKLINFLDKNIPNLNPAVKTSVANKVAGTHGLNITKILSQIEDPNDKQKIKLLANNAKSVLKEIIAPIEMIVHDFSVEILKGLESLFILDSNKEVKRLRGEVSNAIKAIKSSGNEDAIKILDQQFKKLKDVERVFTAAEGFVFVYDGMTYKFTGNFAPVNQILGLFKFGRGKIPALGTITKQSDKNKIVAILPGSYKPPHAGHYLGAKYCADISNLDEVKILISTKERTAFSMETGEGIVIDAEKSFKIWKIFTKHDPKIKIEFSQVPSPVQEVYDTIIKLNPGDTLLVGKGEKETSDDTRFKRAQDWAEKNNTGVTVKPIMTKIDKKFTNISSSNLRDLIAQNKKEEFLRFMPSHLSSQEKEEIWDIIITGQKTMKEHIVKSGSDYCVHSKKSNKNLGCASSEAGAEKREKQVNYFKHLNKEEEELKEMSSGGGGSAEGGMKACWDKTKFENLMINRETFLEELKLRERIQNFIKETENKIDENLELRKLLKIIINEEFINYNSSILMEAKQDSPAHASTGINVLEELLKKIVPQLEQDYKTLTTNAEQRDSFRAHILNAVSKTLTTADINQQAGQPADAEPSMNLAESIIMPQNEVEVDVGQTADGEKDKFIDINKSPDDAEEEDTFGIEGKDVTGRNMAQATYGKIEKNILDSYALLSDTEDKQLFYDYLLTNLKLYFDKFESEIETDVQEPEAGDDIAADAEGMPPSGEETSSQKPSLGL